MEGLPHVVGCLVLRRVCQGIRRQGLSYPSVYTHIFVDLFFLLYKMSFKPQSLPGFSMILCHRKKDLLDPFA